MSLVKKAHQRLYFLRKLKGVGLNSNILSSFYRCMVDSILTSCITVWYCSCTEAEKKALQRLVKSAQKTTGCSFPPLSNIYSSRCTDRATCIMRDPTHPAHELFCPLHSGRRLRSIQSRSTRMKNSFFPDAVRLLNSSTMLQP